MQYQRRKKEYEKKKLEKSEEPNNQKKIITTTIETISTEKKPTKITQISYKAGTGTKEKIQEVKEKEFVKGEKVTTIKKSIIQTTEGYTKIEPISVENKPSSFKAYLSSRYHHSRQIEGSPKLRDQISGAEDNEYNIHTLNARKSPDNISFKRNSFENEKKYNQYSNNPLFDNQTNIEKDNNTYKTNTNESVKIAFNTKSYRQPMIPQNKMSPILNYDDGNSSYDNKKYSEQKNRNTNFLTNNNNISSIEGVNLNMSNYNTNNRAVFSTYRIGSRDRVLSDANSPSYNNEKQNSKNSSAVPYRELKRIVKKFNKVYDPYKNDKGLLIKQSQVTVPGASDEIFNNRFRVLSKMNRLSNILLSKQKKSEEDYISSRDASKDKLQERRNSKNKSVKKTKKLLLVSLRMMSGNEDKTILRKMRNEKGGVVDLAQEKLNKNKFKIKKASKTRGGRTFLKSNPKYREKAAKIIQAWWKELKDLYNYKLQQIIKIQSVWKGRWVRKNIYDLLYLNYLYLSFCEKIQKVLNDNMARYAFEKLKRLQKTSQDNDKEKLKIIVIKKDKRRISLLREYWEKWLKQLENDKMKKNKGKNLIQIRADKENKLGKLRTAFTIWKFNTKMENIKNRNLDKNGDEKEEYEEIEGEGSSKHKKVIKITRISEKERYLIPGGKEGIIEKDKFKGLLKIIEGANNFHKKQAYDETKPKIIKYLTKLAKDEKLRKLLNKKIKRENYILKRILYKWLTKTTLILSNLEKENEEDKIDKNDYTNLKAKIFLRRIENVKNKKKKMLLRKYFYRYLKNVLRMGKEEERQKLLDLNNKPDNKYDINNLEQENIKKDIISFSYYAKNRYKKNSGLKSSTSSIKRIGYNNISNNLEACKILERYLWRKTHKDILQCFKEKMDTETLIIKLLKIFKIKERIEQNMLKDYLDRWKNNTFKKKNNDLISKMFLKIIKIIIDNNEKRLLNKKLYQWLKIVHILNGKDTTFLKSKNTIDFVDDIKKFINKKFASFFLDRLNLLKNKNLSNEVLKKIISKQDNKRNKMLLRDALNKWRNKLADYKIETLKGKLLLKIYDRYKLNKIKDALKNKLSKWANNTILIYKITKKVNKETTEKFNEKNNKDKITIILSPIIRCFM